MGRRLLRFLPALALVAIAVAFFASGAARELSPSELAGHVRDWRAAAERHPIESVAAYVGAYAVLAAAGLPVALVLTIAGGAIFGPLAGALAAVAAANSAALMAYGAARSALGPLLARWLGGRGGQAEALVERLRAEGFWPIVSLRLLPVAPFAVINFAAGAARVRLGAFAAATLLGGLPSAVLFATLGSALGDKLAADSLATAARSPMIWGPLAILSVLAALPIVFRRRAGLLQPAEKD